MNLHYPDCLIPSHAVALLWYRKQIKPTSRVTQYGVEKPERWYHRLWVRLTAGPARRG